MSASESGYAFPWEREAMRGEPMPGDLSLPEQMAYIPLRSLYYDYYGKRIPRDAASAEKRKIISACKEAMDELAYQDKMADFRARVLRDTEAAKTAVRKDPSPENAIRLCDVLDALEKYMPEETTP